MASLIEIEGMIAAMFTPNAEAGIVEYWQIDIQKGCLVVRRDPSDGEYRYMQVYRRGESIAPSQFPNVFFTVDELLG